MDRLRRFARLARRPAARLPVEDLWRTVDYQRVVLAVVRTVTTGTRLLDVLLLLRTDPRIQIVFTFERSSAFTPGVTRFIRDIGAEVKPWREAVHREYSLAISASENGALHELSAPLLLLPHGAGHSKYAKGTRTVSGYNPRRLVHNGRIVPRALVLSHREQVDQLARSCPAAVPRAVVARDVCLDRLLASLPHRARYLRALGNTGQRLVAVSSTWGRTSLFGQDAGLARRLLHELPRDEYQVAFILHPNVWAEHSRYEVLGWLSSALAAGLLVIPPEDGWRAVLAAADLLVGDHGSLSLYAAAIGVPVLLAAFDGTEIVEGTPMAELGLRAPRLGRGPLRGQVESALRQNTAPLRAIADRAFASDAPGLRELLYDLIGLDPPDDAPAQHVEDPVPQRRHVEAHRVVTRVVDATTVALERFSASLPGQAAGADQHFAVEDDTFDLGLVHQAAVLIARHRPDDFAEWAGDVFAEHPTVRVAAADRQVWHRSWSRPRLVTGDAALAASALCALVARHPDFAGDALTVVLGDRKIHLRFVTA